MLRKIFKATSKYFLIYSFFCDPVFAADLVSVTGEESCVNSSSYTCSDSRIFTEDNQKLLFDSLGNLTLSGYLGSPITDGSVSLFPSARGVVVNSGITGVEIDFASATGKGIKSSVTNKTGPSIYSALGGSIKTLTLSSGAINSADTAIFLTDSDSEGTDIIVKNGAFIQGARHGIRWDTDYTIPQTSTNSFASAEEATAGITGTLTLRVSNEGIIAANPRLISQPTDLSSNVFFSSGDDRVQRNITITNEAIGKIYGGMQFGNKQYNDFDSSAYYIQSEVSIANRGLISSSSIISDFSTKLTLTNEVGGIIRIEESPIAGSEDVAETAATSTDIFEAYEGSAFASDAGALYRAPEPYSIRPQGGNSVITNYGTIVGDLHLALSSQTINLNGGTATGDILLAGTLNFNNDLSEDAVIGDITTRADRLLGTSTARINIGTKTYSIGADDLNNTGSLSILAGTGSNPIISTTFTNDGAVGRLNFKGSTGIASGVRLNIDIGTNYSYLKSGVDYLVIDGDYTETGITTSNVVTVDDSNISINDGTMGDNKIGILTIHSAARDLIESTGKYKDLVIYIERLSADEITTDENAKKVYEVIGEIGSDATGSLKDFQQFIDTSSDLNSISDALKSATPQSDDGIRQASLNIFNNSAQSIESRLDEIRAAYFGGFSNSNQELFNNLTQELFNAKTEIAAAFENAYLNMHENYLNARATLVATEPSSLESESSYLSSRAAYLDARSAFLKSEINKLESDSGLVKSGAISLKTESAYFEARDNYLKAIEKFLASEPKYKESESAYLDARAAYLNAQSTTKSAPIDLQAKAALQTAKANQDSLYGKYLNAKDQFAKVQLQYSPDSETSYLEARAAYLNSKAKLEKFDLPRTELEEKAVDSEAKYFKARTAYLSAKKDSLKLDQAANVENLKSVYLNARDDFLRSQQATMIEETTILRKSSVVSKALLTSHVANLNRYLDSILSFLRSQQKYSDFKDSYLASMEAYSNSQAAFQKSKNASLKLEESYKAKSKPEAAKQKLLEARAAYLNSPANPKIDPEADYLKSREVYLASLETLVNESLASIKKDSNLVEKNIVQKNSVKELNLLSEKDSKHSAGYKKTNSLESKDLFKNTNAWAQTFGIDAKQSNFNGIGGEGYNLNTSGLILGLDAEISKRSRAGLALSFANSNIKALDKLKRIGVETYQINAYSGHLFGKYFLDTIGAFALSNYESYRTISSIGATANASFDGQGYAAKIRGGYVKKLDHDFSLIPEASLMFANNNVSDYSENGAGTMNLDVRSNATNFLEGRIGLNLNYKATTKKGSILTPQLKASYGYDFIGKRQSTVSSFFGQSSTFTTVSSKYDPSSFRAGGALDFYQLNSITLSSEYSLELKSKYQSHSGSVRGTYRF